MSISGGEAGRPSRKQLRAHRKIFWEAWRKAQQNLPLNAMEVRIARVIRMHPHYHHLFDDMERFLDRDFSSTGLENPYLHLSLHLAIEEQLAMHHPPEASMVVEHLMQKGGLSRHDALHLVMEALAESVHEAQFRGGEPDVEAYRRRLKELIRR